MAVSAGGPPPPGVRGLVPRGEAGTGSGQGLLCGASTQEAATNMHAIHIPPVSRIARHCLHCRESCLELLCEADSP